MQGARGGRARGAWKSNGGSQKINVSPGGKKPSIVSSGDWQCGLIPLVDGIFKKSKNKAFFLYH